MLPAAWKTRRHRLRSNCNLWLLALNAQWQAVSTKRRARVQLSLKRSYRAMNGGRCLALASPPATCQRYVSRSKSAAIHTLLLSGVNTCIRCLSHSSTPGCWDTIALFWLAELVAPWLLNVVGSGRGLQRLELFAILRLRDVSGLQSFTVKTLQGRHAALPKLQRFLSPLNRSLIADRLPRLHAKFLCSVRRRSFGNYVAGPWSPELRALARPKLPNPSLFLPGASGSGLFFEVIVCHTSSGVSTSDTCALEHRV